MINLNRLILGQRYVDRKSIYFRKIFAIMLLYLNRIFLEVKDEFNEFYKYRF